MKVYTINGSTRQNSSPALLIKHDLFDYAVK
jgi:hypothetical protein